MANFGLDDLRLVNPYDAAFREAVSAVGGAHVLQTARVFRVAGGGGGRLLAGGRHHGGAEPGSAATGRAARSGHGSGAGAPISGGRVALLFGSEKFGLSNEDMSFCHTLIRIPTAPGTPSMNLGQAVAVCLYELIREEPSPAYPVPASPDNAPRPGRFDPIGGKDAEQVTALLLEMLRASGYTNRITATSTEQKIRRWIRRLRIGRRDAPLLMGILRQVLWKFANDRSGGDRP